MNSDEKSNIKSRTQSILRRLKHLLGVGPHLLILGLFFETLTIIIRQWLSFPITLAYELKIFLTIACIFICLLGILWFNLSLNLVRVNLLRGEAKLITYGPFSYVRHPLYSTILFTIPPLFIIWFEDLLFFIPWSLSIISTHISVFFEERGLIDEFGDDYERYRRYVPALIPYKGAAGKRYRNHQD